MSEFLENLKNAADNGEFNSDAAKKILEISELADKKLQGKNPEEEIENLKESLEKRQEEEVVEVVSEEKAIEANTEYEKKMAQFKEQDAINNQLAVLMEIEDMVKASINDMLEHVETLESGLKEKLNTESYADLKKKIEAIKTNYEKQDRTSWNFR